jgi:hypothetical protein
MSIHEHSRAIQSDPASAQPEFADARTARNLFSLPRCTLYNLNDAGKIKSVSLRQPGALRGKRLFDCASIRSYLAAEMEAAKQAAAESATEAMA